MFNQVQTHSSNSKRTDGLCIGMRRPSVGELLGLAVLTKALALGDCQWPGWFNCCAGTSTGAAGRDALGLSHLTLIGTVVRTTV